MTRRRRTARSASTPAALRRSAGSAPARRGSAYLLVLVTVTIVTATALSALLVQRVRVRRAELATDSTAARRLAASAIELGLQTIVDTPDWRDSLGGGAWMTNTPLGEGLVSLDVLAPDGSPLAKGSAQPATLVATAAVGGATQLVELAVQNTPLPPEPMAVLSYAAVAGSELSIKDNKTVSVSGAPLATNKTLVLNKDSSVVGDAEAMSRSGTGTISGNATIPGTIKPMPGASVITDYEAQATSIDTKHLHNALLSPATNTVGAANPDGIYLIKNSGDNVVVHGIRLLGTLIVDTGGSGTVTIDNSVLMEALSPDQPVLLVIGNLVIDIDSTDWNKRLSESSSKVNFNPSGTPYEGRSDYDKYDRYPNTIRGLIHATGTVTFKDTAGVTGVLIAESGLAVDQDATLIHDPTIASSPPPGYTFSPGDTTTIVAGSWKKRVN